jgi:uncharacterized protein YycO
MKLIFQRRPHSLFERAICWWTGGPYFHVAMVFHDNILIESLAGFGVRMAVVENIDPARWTTVEVPTTVEEEAIIQKWAVSEVGCKYDWLGIFMAQFLGIPRASRNKWFCSELVMDALHQIGRWLPYKPCTVSPNKLYKLVTKG